MKLEKAGMKKYRKEVVGETAKELMKLMHSEKLTKTLKQKSLHR